MMLIGLFCKPPLRPMIDAATRPKNTNERVVYQYFLLIMTAGFTLVFLVRMIIANKNTTKTTIINQKSTINCVTKPP